MKAVANRRFSHGGKEYAAGAAVELTESQFADWKAAGLVKAAPDKETKVKAASAAI